MGKKKLENSITNRNPRSTMKSPATLTLVMSPACLFFLLLATSSASAQEGSERDEKILSLFDIVKIPNDMCAGTTKNGTCYTSSECTSLGGKAEGTCGSGYGVCCIFSLACSGSASYNNSYMVMPTPTTSCSYTICPMSSSITRIRFDFENFVLAQPALTTNVAGAIAITTKNSAGQCVTDAFGISSASSTP